MVATLQPGLIHQFEKITEPGESAAAVASGALDVFSTPSLVALFESTALQAVQSHLPPGCTTVGIEVSVRHLKATRIGQFVRCQVSVSQVEGKRIAFAGEMWDEQGKIGDGTHVRYIVNSEEFIKRLG